MVAFRKARWPAYALINGRACSRIGSGATRDVFDYGRDLVAKVEVRPPSECDGRSVAFGGRDEYRTNVAELTAIEDLRRAGLRAPMVNGMVQLDVANEWGEMVPACVLFVERLRPLRPTGSLLLDGGRTVQLVRWLRAANEAGFVLDDARLDNLGLTRCGDVVPVDLARLARRVASEKTRTRKQARVLRSVIESMLPGLSVGGLASTDLCRLESAVVEHIVRTVVSPADGIGLRIVRADDLRTGEWTRRTDDDGDDTDTDADASGCGGRMAVETDLGDAVATLGERDAVVAMSIAGSETKEAPRWRRRGVTRLAMVCRDEAAQRVRGVALVS